MARAKTFFDIVTYTGTGATNSITGLNFQPDLVWIKSRSAATDHKLTDSVRGVTKGLIADSTGAETTDTNGLTSFNSGGFSLGTDTNYNNNGATYVAWCWKAGGASVTNNNGSITSQVSTNTTSGFSVVTYTGNGGSNQSVGHGLGVTPAFVIMKSRSLTGSSPPSNWICWHQSISQAIQTSSTIQLNSFTGAIYLNLTNASSTYGIDAQINASGQTYVAYCWAAIPGFSAFGSYTGNGSTDGPFVYCGFRPRFVLIRNSSIVADWEILDTSRDPYNVTYHDLLPDSALAEATATNRLDILSNGFKLRDSNTLLNGSGNIVLYAAFADVTFKYARGR